MVVRKAAHMAERMRIPIVGIIENMSYLVCPECGGKIRAFGFGDALRTANTLGVPLLGRLPLDPKLATHCDSGEIEKYESEPFGEIVSRAISSLKTEQTKPLFEEGKHSGPVSKVKHVTK
jgi:hypothetical protein